MPYFRVMMHGMGIRIPDQDGSDPIVGFFTTRLVRAVSTEAAGHKAEAMLLAEWKSPPYVDSNKGDTPRITIEQVNETGFLDSLRFKNTGHTFYTEEDGDPGLVYSMDDPTPPAQ